MIISSLLLEEDRLVCVTATSRLTDSDRGHLLSLYGEDYIRFVSVCVKPFADRSRVVIEYTRGTIVQEATFSSSSISGGIKYADLDEFCQQFPDVYFECLDATAVPFDEDIEVRHPEVSTNIFSVGVFSDAIVATTDSLFTTPHVRKEVCNHIVQVLYDNYERYIDERIEGGKTRCALSVKVTSEEKDSLAVCK